LVSEVTDQIKSRGYWNVLIRPSPFQSDRIAYTDLQLLLEKHAVRLRGWPLPYIDHRQQLLHGQHWIGQDIPARVVDHIEAWRFFTSGQFNQLRAIGADWRGTADALSPSTVPPAGFDSVIEVWEILFYVTEVFELAARLALSEAGGESMTLKIQLENLGTRALVIGDPRRMPLDIPYGPPPPTTSFEATLGRDQLVAESDERAVDMAADFLARFGWNAPKAVLSDYQRELTRHSRPVQ
jgi:hypothetical protein